MKVGIYFFVRTHATFLDEILGQIPGDSEIDLYCTKAYQHINYPRIHTKPASIFQLLLKARHYDRIVIDEVTGRYLLFLPLFVFWKQKVFLVIHNLRSWVKPVFFSKFSGFIHSCLRRLIFTIYKHYIVVGTGMKKYGQQLCPDKKFYFVPFGLSAKAKAPEMKKKTDQLFIVVPGTVSNRRKYEWVLSALEDPDLKTKVRFSLLGKAEDDYGHEIVQRIKASGFSNVSIFETFIQEAVYIEIVNEADFILSDFELNYETRYGQIETYGETKETGVSFLLLSHEKPGLLPAGFKCMEEIESQLIRFDSYQSLKQILLKSFSDRSLAEALSYQAKTNRARLAATTNKIF